MAFEKRTNNNRKTKEFDGQIKRDLWQVEQAWFIIYWAALMLQQGTNEAGNTKEHYLLQEKSAAWGGVDTVAQHSYITVHKHNTLLLLSDENPITPILMIFMFLPELEDFVTLYKFHTPRTRKSHCMIYKTARLSEWKWGCAVLFRRIFWHFGNVGFTTQSDHNRGTQENAYTPPGKTEDGSNQFKPPLHMPVVLNNASTFP